ncbi:MAG: Gfo/Idh/MocA family oxidoreductase [Chloroflexota bacterium]
MADKIRWGVLSTANIGRKSVIPAIQKSKNGEMVAVASRDEARAREFADANNIPQAFGSYEALLDSGEVDAIYNPLPNHLHAPWSKAAADRGIAVLCEKPLAMDAAEAQGMVDYFEEKRVLLAEAFMWRFHPQHDVVRKLIADGEIGEMKVMNATFSFVIGDEGNIRLKPEMGGGSLWDVGCYCVNSMRNIIGEEPDGGFAFGRFGKDSMVDESLSATLSFPGGVVGHFDCGFRAHQTDMYDIRGTNGRIRVWPSYTPNADKPTTVHLWRGKNEAAYEAFEVEPANQYTLMVEDFNDALLNDRPFRYPIADAVQNMIVLDNLLASAKSDDGYWS